MDSLQLDTRFLYASASLGNNMQTLLYVVPCEYTFNLEESLHELILCMHAPGMHI